MWLLSLLGLLSAVIGVLLAIHLWTGGLISISDTLGDILDLIFFRPGTRTKVLVPLFFWILGAVLYGLSYMPAGWV